MSVMVSSDIVHVHAAPDSVCVKASVILLFDSSGISSRFRFAIVFSYVDYSIGSRVCIAGMMPETAESLLIWMLICAVFVVGLPGNYCPNTAHRICTIACAPRDHVHMRIHHSLSGSSTTIHAHIVSVSLAV